jgi:hypothetical protein
LRSLLIALLTVAILAFGGTQAVAKKHSASPFAAPEPSANLCGTSVREAIAAVEQVLAEKTADAETRALTCIVVALKLLDSQRLDAVRGTDNAHVLSVPKTP